MMRSVPSPTPGADGQCGHCVLLATLFAPCEQLQRSAVSLPERLRDKGAAVQLQRSAVSLTERLRDKRAVMQLQRNAVSPRCAACAPR